MAGGWSERFGSAIVGEGQTPIAAACASACDLPISRPYQGDAQSGLENPGPERAAMETSSEVLGGLVPPAVFKTVAPQGKPEAGGFDSHALPLLSAFVYIRGCHKTHAGLGPAKIGRPVAQALVVCLRRHKAGSYRFCDSL